MPPDRSHRHQHDDDDDGAVPADHPAERSRRPAHRRVVRLPRRRGLQLLRIALRDGPRAAPAARDRRQRDPAPVDRRELAAGARAPARDRRLHLDRLGLPRRGGDRDARSTAPATPTGSWARTRGSPPTAATSTSPGTAARSRTGARSSGVGAPRPTSRCGRRSTTARTRRAGAAGRSPTRSRRGRGPDSRTSPSRSRCTPTPTRWSCSSTARPSVEHPQVGEPTPSGPSSRPPTRPAS